MDKIAATLVLFYGLLETAFAPLARYLADLTTEGNPAWLSILERYGIAAICAFIAWIFIKRDAKNFERREEMHREQIETTTQATLTLTSLATRSAEALESSNSAARDTQAEIRRLTHAIENKLPCSVIAQRMADQKQHPPTTP